MFISSSLLHIARTCINVSVDSMMYYLNRLVLIWIALFLAYHSIKMHWKLIVSAIIVSLVIGVIIELVKGKK